MKEHSIEAAVKKRRFRRTTDSGHPYALASNLLIERSQTEGIWASDMTFVPTSEGWLYVAAVMNVKSRKIIGLSMSDKLYRVVESFFGTLKTELVHGERYRSRLEARLSIFEYVEVFYNRQRSHSALGYRSPEQYEKLLNET
jgi:transposase InsO family protein